MKTAFSCEALRERTGIPRAQADAAASEYAEGLVPVIDAVLAEPEHLWRAHDMIDTAGVVSVFNLDRILTKATGYDFAELVDRARVLHALDALSQTDASVDEIAEVYWPPRTRNQLLKEQKANVAVVDNKLSSRENLDAAFVRVLEMSLNDVVGAVRA
jgi:AraC-like DNA-binding protein